MEITEQTILTEVHLLVELDAIRIRWNKLIVRGDAVINSTPHIGVYVREHIDRLLADVPGAEKYVQAMGWSLPDGEG